MVRRPITTLVAQGILPSPKTSPALYEQRQKLERAKMGDMLRAKIARRPDRSELVHRHILEDVRPGVDPSLCDKQRQLKRAKLADTLSNQLQARPGPLELVAKNILHVNEDEDEAVADGMQDKNRILSASGVEFEHMSKLEDCGQIQLPEFTPTKEGIPTVQVAVPHRYTLYDDSSSDVSGILSPPDVFSSISDSPSGFLDNTAPSTPSSICLSQQMSPGICSELPTNLLTPKSIKPIINNFESIISASSATKAESHEATIAYRRQEKGSKPSRLSEQPSKSVIQPGNKSGAKQHKRRASAADASIFIAPSPPANFGHTTPGRVSGHSSNSQSPSPSPATTQNGSIRPGSLQLINTGSTPSIPYSQRGAPGKDQTSRRKSAKGKKGPGSTGSGSSGIGGKQKVIKFHEYKVLFVLIPIPYFTFLDELEHTYLSYFFNDLGSKPK